VRKTGKQKGGNGSRLKKRGNLEREHDKRREATKVTAAKDRRRKSQERLAPSIADIRQVVGPLGAQLEAVIEANCRQALAGDEVLRAKEQLGTEFGGLKQPVEVLGRDNRRLSQPNDVRKRDVGATVAEGSGNGKQEIFGNLVE
jgi:hypothetical protein